MSWRDDFDSDAGWSAVDCSTQLLGSNGARFRKFLADRRVDFVVRYYAAKPKWKTISPSEAQALRDDGLKILPVFQENGRNAGDFTSKSGKAHAQGALRFAKELRQPEGSTILFAVDGDMVESEVTKAILPYFEAVKSEISGRYRIGAYAGGQSLDALLRENLIDVSWLTMSPGFGGTEAFFKSGKWSMRQVRPETVHMPSGIGYDRNVLNVNSEKIGAFHYGDTTIASKYTGKSGKPLVKAGAENTFYVRTQGLNLRKDPDGEIIRALNIADPVIDSGTSGVAGWRKVVAGKESGVVAERYLRPPVAPEVEELLRKNIDEWLRFDMGSGKEDKDPYYKYIGEMWKALGESHDGKSAIRWSAAYISWVIKNAGSAYENFKFAQAHSVFVNDAIYARRNKLHHKPFWGYRISEAPPELGDIIQYDSVGEGYNFDFAENNASYPSHSDVVVEVTAELVRVIGGNIGDGVSLSSGAAGTYRVYRLTPDGLIASGQRVIALLKNRAALATAKS